MSFERSKWNTRFDQCSGKMVPDLGIMNKPVRIFPGKKHEISKGNLLSCKQKKYIFIDPVKELEATRFLAGNPVGHDNAIGFFSHVDQLKNVTRFIFSITVGNNDPVIFKVLIGVFIEVIASRLLLFSFFLIAISIIAIAVILFIKIFTDKAVPGWATSALSSMLIVLLQSFLLSLFTIFLFLSAQGQRKFIPALHYQDYVRSVETFAHV